MLNDAGFFASGKAHFLQEYCMPLKGFPTVIFQGKWAKPDVKKTSQVAFWRLLNRSIVYFQKKFRHIVMHTQSEKYKLKISLDDIDLLKFMRANSKWYVNSLFIKKVDLRSVVLKNGMIFQRQL